MNKIIIFALFSLYLLIYMFKHTVSPKNPVDTTEASMTQASQTVIKSNPIVEVKKEIESPKKIKISKQPSIISLFEEEDIDFVNLKIKPIQNVKPIAAIRMEKNKIKTIQIGDSLILPTIDGNNYTLKVKHRSITKRGTVSIDGDYYEDGISYSAILTEGTKSAFISMSTPTGMYEIELFDGLGYIYRSSEIEDVKIDSSLPDTLKHKM